MSGVPLPQIMDLLGHTDVKTTQIYVHVAPKHLRDAIGKLAYTEDGAQPTDGGQGGI
jgi:site-specific recombinase XerD